MFPVRHEAIIRAPVEAAFAAASDPQVQLRWDPETLKSVEKLSSGPLGKGSRYRGQFKGFGSVEYEFPEFDPPHRFAHLAKVRPGRMLHTFEFSPADGGTRLVQTGDLEPNLLGRLMKPMMGRMLAKRFAAVADELDTYLGSPSAT